MKDQSIKQPSVFNFIAAIPNEDAARQYLADARWPNGVTCHHCGHDKIWTIKSGRLYTCQACRKQFTVRTGTVMEDSKLPLTKWIYAMYLMTVSRKGISSIQLAKELGITQKSAWHLGHRIREACATGGLLSGTVEADECYFGGSEKNKHANKKTHRGRGWIGKTIAFGVKERDGEVRASIIQSDDREVLHNAVESTVEKGSMIYTDSHGGYQKIQGYKHEAVKHQQGEYVKGEAHTNSIESFWAILKRAYIGTFHHWDKKHAARYLNEFAFKQNTKGLPAFDAKGIGSNIAAVREFMTGAEGKRLTYEALTANA